MNFQTWLSYFQSNKNHFQFLRCGEIPELSKQEKTLITKSLQQFQKGENSEGKNLYGFAKAFDNEYYTESIKLFIKEEQTHALVLSKFMQQEGIVKIKDHWVDNVFRYIRKFSNLENSIIVLSSAELIADTFYKALYNASNSRTLKEICEQILIDEEAHLNFQAFTLKHFYLRSNYFTQQINKLYHRLLMVGVILIVWMYHSKLLKTGGYSFKKFYKNVMNDFENLRSKIKSNIAIVPPQVTSMPKDKKKIELAI